jgi:hypothetical protein
MVYIRAICNIFLGLQSRVLRARKFLFNASTGEFFDIITCIHLHSSSNILNTLYERILSHSYLHTCLHTYVLWCRGVVVIISANGTEDGGFECHQVVRC